MRVRFQLPLKNTGDVTLEEYVIRQILGLSKRLSRQKVVVFQRKFFELVVLDGRI